MYAKRPDPGVSEVFLPILLSRVLLVADEDGQLLMNIPTDDGGLPSGATPPEVVTLVPENRGKSVTTALMGLLTWLRSITALIEVEPSDALTLTD